MQQITESNASGKKRLQGTARAVARNMTTWKDDIKKNYIRANKSGTRGEVRGGVNTGNSG